MKLFEAVVEMQPNKELTFNGRHLAYLRDHDVPMEEKIIEKDVPLEQQWFLICEMKKMVARLEFTYRKSRVRHGEVTDPKIVTSGAMGIKGTNIGKL